MMMHVHSGTETYGRVKAVAGTAIVTKFFMLQSLPIFPLRSYYFIRHGETTRTSVPLIGSEAETTVIGLPLASIDVASALMAYVRAVFALLTIAGSLVMIPAGMYLCGEHPNDQSRVVTGWFCAILATGVVGGGLTYLIPMTSRRDREIRGSCAKILGVSADPARVTAEARGWIGGWLDSPRSPSDDPQDRLIRQLIACRLELPDSGNAQALQDRTDDLLERLKADAAFD